MAIQDKFNKSNTIYKITKDIDLGGGTLTIPEGCTLDFQGGSFSDGTIVGNNTKIKAGLETLFGEGLILDGSWDVDYAYPEWFGASSHTEIDSWEAITRAFSMNLHVKLGVGTYYISKPININISYKIEGELQKTVITPLPSIDSIECILYVNSGEDSYSYGYIRNLNIIGDNKAKYGLKCYYVSSTSVIENLLISACTEAGLYLTRCWYAVFKNIRSWANKYGLYIYGLPQTSGEDTEKTDNINGVNFNSCWLNHNTESALYIYRGGSAISFTSCTFENSSGEQEIKLESLDNDITFYSCYWETNTKLIDAEAAYDYAASLNFIGGLLTQRSNSAQYMTIRKFQSISFIGCSWRSTAESSTASPLIDVSNAKVFALGGLPYSAVTFNSEANVFLLGTANNWNQDWRASIIKSLSGISVSALSNENGDTTAPSTAELVVGAAQLQNVSSNYGCYRLKFVLDKESNSFKVKLVKNYSNSEVTQDIFTIGQWGDVIFSGRVKGLITSGYGTTEDRPNWSNQYAGMMYFDTTLGKPIWMKSNSGDNTNAIWVDAEGNTAAAAKSSSTQERPTNVNEGFDYYDSTLKKKILWNGTEWVNLDGTALAEANAIEEVPASQDTTY